MSTPGTPTERTRLRRHRERGTHDRADLNEVLDAGLICHLGAVVDGTPLVLPTAYGRIGDTLYLHGSVAGRTLAAAGGTQVCVTVTHLDGVVLARSVFDHSMNYRSAMIFGRPRTVTDPDEVEAGLRAIVEHSAPGQWDTARQPSRKDLAATTVIALALDEASVKIRAGGPAEPEEQDADRLVWTGVLPIRQVWGAPEPDPAMPRWIAVPGHFADISGRRVDDNTDTAPASA
jgi:hypothetical protein